MKALVVAREALRVERQRISIRHDRQQLAFMPAAVEVTETPVAPTARFMIGLLCALVVGAVTWSWFAKVDTVGVAPGQLVPAGQIKTVRSLETAIIKTVHVADGDQVAAGQVLVSLDPAQQQADEGQARRDLIEARIASAALTAAIEGIGSTGADLRPVFGRHLDQALVELNGLAPPEEMRAIAVLHRTTLMAELQALHQARAATELDILAQHSLAAATQAEIDWTKERLPLLEDRASSLATLLAKDLTERWRWQEAKEAALRASQGFYAALHRLNEIEAVTKALNARDAATFASARQSLMERQTASMRDAASAQLTLDKAAAWREKRFLRAPVAGAVTGLAVHTDGGVIAEGEVALSIVPDDAPLVLAAKALNKDIAFISEGQAVEIKLETLPYTRFGLVSGTVDYIADNAVIDDVLGAVYPIKVKLGAQQVHVNGDDLSLAAGMTATAEIKTGERRVIDFFLSPFQEYQEEALRER